jgi:4-amino-4-deoxy-L-arabinose transferase and related glycosyltransferases of PMT family
VILSRSQYFLKRASIVYLIALVVCCLLFFSHVMTWYWIVAGIVEVWLFYYLSVQWEIGWKKHSPATIERNLFWATLITRLLWIFGYYLFTLTVWHTPWEQPIGTTMDSAAYYEEAIWLIEMIKEGDISPYLLYIRSRIDDAGYPVFVAICNFISNNSIIFTRVPNAFFDAWTVVLTYRLAKRNFGESVGRLSAYFVILLPMIVFYSGTTMKESLMLVLSMWAVERGDFVIREKKYLTWHLATFAVPVLLLTFIRVALSWVIILAFLCAVVFSSERIINKSRRVLILFLVIFVGAAFFGGRIIEQGEDLVEQANSTGANFEYRAQRQGGNVLVSRMNKMVLAPLIFTLPFPTMVEIEGQYVQQLQNGGYFLKNILSFFCIFALFSLLPKRRWKDNVMVIAYLLGYLMALSLSSFAQSGRFHHPALPLEMIFGAYGISLIKNIKQAKWFDYFLIVEFFIIVFWNWFKLRGRGAV